MLGRPSILLTSHFNYPSRLLLPFFNFTPPNLHHNLLYPQGSFFAYNITFPLIKKKNILQHSGLFFPLLSDSIDCLSSDYKHVFMSFILKNNQEKATAFCFGGLFVCLFVCFGSTGV
jgi:hypothetical protein